VKSKSNVQIVNWLLTRRCNLRCDYCGIVRNPTTKIYPNIKYYENNEMTSEYVISQLSKFKNIYPDCFHIFYGGEPLLYKGLSDVVSYCNEKEIWYTIITNNSVGIRPEITKLIDRVGRLQGLTASIDPVIYDPDMSEKKKYRKEKSLAGLKNLISLSDRVDDMVAEITIDSTNLEYVDLLVKKLSSYNIWSSITFVDPKKSDYYDFSHVTVSDELVYDSQELRILFNKMIDDGLKIHMAEELLDRTLNILPSEFDCELENDIHNLTIDADGSIRLCLRIRGVKTTDFKIDQFFEQFENIHEKMSNDKSKYCKKCNWTCPIMSKLAVEENMTKEILHENRK